MRSDWLRSRPARLLMAATFTVSLLFGAAFVVVDRLHTRPTEALHLPRNPVSDQESWTQAVGAAKNIAGLGKLRTTTAGYLLMSCQDRDSPPYQGTVYLTFALPAETRAEVYLPGLGAKLVSAGWIEGLPPNNHAYGHTLTKDAVTAVIYRHDDNPALGTLRLYGECRNMTDHRTDSTAWVDITGEFASAG